MRQIKHIQNSTLSNITARTYRDHYGFNYRWQNIIIHGQNGSDYKPNSFIELLFILLTILVYSSTIWLTNFIFFFNNTKEEPSYYYETYAISLLIALLNFINKMLDYQNYEENRSKGLIIIKQQYLEIITLVFLVIKLSGVNYCSSTFGICFQLCVLMIFYLESKMANQPIGNQRIYIIKSGKVQIIAGKRLNKVLKMIQNQSEKEVLDNSYGITSVISARKPKIYAVSKGFTSAYSIDAQKFKESINEKMAYFQYYHQTQDQNGSGTSMLISINQQPGQYQAPLLSNQKIANKETNQEAGQTIKSVYNQRRREEDVSRQQAPLRFKYPETSQEYICGLRYNFR